jgi:hypothetical protein
LDDDSRERFEGAFGADFGAVRVHENSAVAPDLGATAFTTGSDIHFAPGQYRPGGRSGDRLLAHELAHVVQNGGPVRRSLLIRRSLIGTHDALLAVEAEKGFRMFKTHGSWTDTLQAVAKYEEMEKKPRATGNMKKHAKEAKALQSQLVTIQKHARSWLKAHEDGIVQAIDDNAAQYGDVTGMSAEHQQGVKKLSAIRNLLRRVRWEQTQIRVGNLRTDRLDDDQLVGNAQDDAVGGQASRLDIVNFGSAGYYQSDRETAGVADSAAGAIGIQGVDPNWSGRSMAAARLDQLLSERLTAAGADLVVADPSLVRMDFASHTRTPQGGQATATTGVFLEQASGAEMRAGYLGGHAVDAEANRANAQQLALDDPVLQRALNKLQLLDAICGQVDRHAANMFVDTDAQGLVTGLQGIDNDMAFGSKMQGDALGLRAGPDNAASGDLASGGRAWRGLPPIADEAVAQAILTITAQDIHDAIDGLIEPAEVDATISRLDATKTFLQQLPPNALISSGDWAARRQELAGRQNAFNSYLGAARSEALAALTNPAQSTKRDLHTEMMAANDAPAISKVDSAGQDVVAEFTWAEDAIYKDIGNLVGKGVTEALAETRGKQIARSFAQNLVHSGIDRTGMTLGAALKTVDYVACARALEQARRTMYAFWG